MQTVVELSTFTKQAEAIFSPEEKDAVIDYLAAYPLAGDEIPGTGGVRKVRVAAKGKGKRGGARVIYYYYNESAPIIAMLVYGKNEKTDLTSDEKKLVSSMVAVLKEQQRSKKR
jgi:mRNA-degrading endonuclease RelE of RelBE toxin-antitoxin system